MSLYRKIDRWAFGLLPGGVDPGYEESLLKVGVDTARHYVTATKAAIPFTAGVLESAARVPFPGHSIDDYKQDVAGLGIIVDVTGRTNPPTDTVWDAVRVNTNDSRREQRENIQDGFADWWDRLKGDLQLGFDIPWGTVALVALGAAYLAGRR